MNETKVPKARLSQTGLGVTFLTFVALFISLPKAFSQQTPDAPEPGPILSGSASSPGLSSNFVPGTLTIPQTVYGDPMIQPGNQLESNCAMAIANAASSMAAQMAQMAILQEQMDAMNERRGFEDDPSLPRNLRINAFNNMRSSFSRFRDGGAGAMACQKFIDKDGNPGPWGRTALAEMAKHPDAYESLVPQDVGRYCPAFSSMDSHRRQLYWLWILASISSPESSCRPGATAQGPNGTAIGLFQLEARACHRVGQYVSSESLLQAEPNIRCAVAVLARELVNRETITSNTSRGSTGTYWGTLRVNPASVDAGGARQAQSLFSRHSDCRKTSQLPNWPTSVVLNLLPPCSSPAF